MKINEKNLCIFATNPPFDYDGFLNKRGEVNKAFQRRYFVLKGNLLFYFEKKGDKEPLGLIIVEGCTIELSEESDQYCFEIAFNGNRTYVLSADSQESMESWMKVLTCAGYEYKKLMVAELQRQLEEIEGSRNKILDDNLTQCSIPKPPPRRQNPFNRPAPPLPTSNVNTNITFINGDFRMTPVQYNHWNQRADKDTSPVPPPRGMMPFGSQKGGYNSQAIKTVAFSTSTSMSGGFINYNSVSFEKLHERFRELVMKDIFCYSLHGSLFYDFRSRFSFRTQAHMIRERVHTEI